MKRRLLKKYIKRGKGYDQNKPVGRIFLYAERKENERNNWCRLPLLL
jgi:hypothetical protein